MRREPSGFSSVPIVPSGHDAAGGGSPRIRSRSAGAFDRSRRSLRGRDGRTGSVAVFGLPASRTGARRPSGRMQASAPSEPDTAENLCLLPALGWGTPAAVQDTARRNGARPRRAGDCRGRHGTCSIQSPWEHRAPRGGNTSRMQRTLRRMKALRSNRVPAGVATRRRCDAMTAGGHVRAVNADPLREEGGSGDALDGCRRGESFEGSSPLGKISQRPSGRGRPRGREVGNVANSRTGCGVQQTRELSRVRSSGRTSAEETVGAGRNGKNGTCSERGSSGPKSRRRSGREWTQRRPCRWRSDSINPMRAVQPVGTAFGPSPTGSDRANRYVFEEEAGQGLDPMRNAHGVVRKANEPPHTGCRRRRAGASAPAVKSPSSPASSTSGRQWKPARESTPGSQRETL